MKKYRVVISGAAGFIGRRLVVNAAKKYGSSNVLALVWNKYTAWESQGKVIIKDVKVDMLEVDLASGKGLEFLKDQSPEVLFHLAAVTNTSERDYSANDKGTENLINSFKSIKRVVYTGTTAIFCGRLDCDKLIYENHSPAPSNEYGRSKLRAENFLGTQANKSRFKLTIVRLPTVYGENPRKNSLFDFLNNLVEKNSWLARLNWPGLTSLVYVDDVAKVLINLKNIGIYHLGSESITLSECSEKMYQTKNKNYKKINIPTIFWKLFSFTRPVIYSCERLIPPKFYNLIWRATLVVDNVIWCDNKKVSSELGGVRWRYFAQIVKDLGV